MPDHRQLCLVVRYNHFDPMWRRCWDRPFLDGDQTFVSYRDIETAWLDDALDAMRDSGDCCMVECAWVLRHYLDRRPERLSELRQYAQNGRFELLASGENIIDVNLVHGETLVRNLLLGLTWAEQTLGVRPTTGWHMDGFGSSAQMPQLFRGVGIRWIAALSYRMPDAPYWRGLDGSCVLCRPDGVYTETGGSHSRAFRKHPPCPECRGTGCVRCDHRGFQPYRQELDAPPTDLSDSRVRLVALWGEEILPGKHVSQAIHDLNRSDGPLTYRQGVYRDLQAHMTDWLDAVDAPPDGQVSSTVENNPTQCGCWVSRIRCKQRHRAAEHALLRAETWDTLLAGGAHSQVLRDAWRRLTFSAFHDAITGTHIDAAYHELMDTLDGVTNDADRVLQDVISASPDERTVTVWNHHPYAVTAPVTFTVSGLWSGATSESDNSTLPVYALSHDDNTTCITLGVTVPAWSASALRLTDGPAYRDITVETSPGRVSCGGYSIWAGEHGLQQVVHGGFGPVSEDAELPFGALTLETDEGDPWTTRSLDRHTQSLAQYTRLEQIEHTPNCVRICYAGAHPANHDFTKYNAKVTWLSWRQVFTLYTDLPWLQVDTEVEWYTHDRRLRLVFPTRTGANRGVYEIPCGLLERDRYDQTSVEFGNGNGDWPAVHWAGIQTDTHTMAVLNAGTPSYRIADGQIVVSLLRSPTVPCCLLEPESYTAYNYLGMMDHGVHRFRHAVCLCPGDWRTNDVSRLAAVFNSKLHAVPGRSGAARLAWSVNAQHTEVLCVKPAESGDGIVIRFVERSGRDDTVELRLPEDYCQAYRTDLLEAPQAELAVTHGTVHVLMAPWQIQTVLCRRGSQEPSVK